MINPQKVAAFELMKEFYVSRYWEPKPERPADNIQAAIKFTLDHVAAQIEADQARVERMRVSLLAVVDAVRDYLPPDGIDAQTFISRVIGAVDNPEINPLIREMGHVPANQL